MPIEITVPVLPESVADALVLDWKKQAGARVSRDEILVEVETDKIVLEVVAPEDGTLSEILRPAGEVVKAGEILAKIEPGVAGELDAAAPSDEAATPDAATGQSDGHDNNRRSDDEYMSPAVRRLVEEHGLNPNEITGSGRNGMVTKEDILEFISNAVTPDEASADAATNVATNAMPNQTPKPTAQPDSQLTAPAAKLTIKQSTTKQNLDISTDTSTGARTETREPMSRLRSTIANRLVQAQQTAALLTTFNEVNMQPVLDLRARCKDEFEKNHGTRLGLMSFFVKAGVAALQKFPLVNARIDGVEIVRHNYHDIGIAVASKRGLLVPILRDCAALNFADIERQIREFGSRAQDGKIELSDLTGGTFTITNGGVFGSLLSTPIVNPPQSAILGMHKIEDRPIAENGQVVIRPMMYLALTYDHRLVDGQEAVSFLMTIKELLEDPARMMLEL